MGHVSGFEQNGERWPSVTECISGWEKPFLWRWYHAEVKKHGWRGWQKCKATANRGARIGQDFHTLMHNHYDPTQPVVLESHPRKQPKIYELLKYATEWVDKQNWAFQAQEQHVISKRYRFHGTFDAIVLTNNELVIIDWKTSNQSDKFHGVQLSAYAQAYYEETGKHVDQGIIVRVDKKTKTPKIHPEVYTGLHYYFPVFNALREAWDYANDTGPWNKGGEIE